jgi:hypothetical protein
MTNPDEIPFDASKNVTLLQPFEVLASSVHRFWSPMMGRHFYTINPAERDKLINRLSNVYVFEGIAFYAWQ